MNRLVLFVLAAALLVTTGAAVQAAVVLSDNIVVNGDFESLDNLKNDTTPDGIAPHRFSTEYDFTKWLAFWGPPENPGGLGGFSTYDDPRDVGETGGNTRITGNLGNFNRSVDPTDPNNHVMDAVMFRGSFFQWIPAPENHVPGPISFSFDLRYSQWTGWTGDGAPWGQLWMIGTNTPPQHDSNVFNGNVSNGGLWPDDGEILFRRVWGEWMEGAYDPNLPPSDPFEFYDTWYHNSTDEYLRLPRPDNPEETYAAFPDGTPNYLWWAGHTVTKEVTQAYDYYVIWATPLVYAETDVYFWLYSPDARAVDNPVHLLDNFNLQLSVEVDDGPAPVPADFNVSGTVNTEDINPFILALTNTPGWINSVRALLPDGWSDQQIMDYADPNQDGVINTEDINPFICWLTGGSNCAGGGAPAIIPEPASLALLGMGALALIRRRR